MNLQQNKGQNVDRLPKRELLQLCIGKYQIIFHFDDEVSISVESSIELLEEKTQERHLFRPPFNQLSAKSSKALLSLVGCVIDKAFLNESKDLVICTPSGQLIWLLNGGNGYESFEVIHKHNGLIV